MGQVPRSCVEQVYHGDILGHHYRLKIKWNCTRDDVVAISESNHMVMRQYMEHAPLVNTGPHQNFDTSINDCTFTIRQITEEPKLNTKCAFNFWVGRYVTSVETLDGRPGARNVHDGHKDDYSSTCLLCYLSLRECRLLKKFSRTLSVDVTNANHQA